MMSYRWDVARDEPVNHPANKQENILQIYALSADSMVFSGG